MLSADRARLLCTARRAAVVVGLILLLAIVVWSVVWGPDPASLAALGYPGIAIAMFICSSTVFLPAPGFVAVLWAGTVWDPLWVGIAAGIGAATGELTGYFLGLGGNILLDFKQSKHWETAHRLFKRYGLWAIIVLAMIPNPIFDAVGVVAGSLSYSIRRFWIACAVGKIGKFLAMAYLADTTVGWLFRR